MVILDELGIYPCLKKDQSCCFSFADRYENGATIISSTWNLLIGRNL
ncbi:MAG: hypothetical protein HS127_03940 [Planctomycetia bacterium]|nr:hypothetical protein [Planctomycetia bacterium]